jgi:hypothetical protein
MEKSTKNLEKNVTSARNKAVQLNKELKEAKEAKDAVLG